MVVTALTVNVNVVVRVNPPPVPVTVIAYEPVGVDNEVLMVHVLVNVGLPDPGLKDVEKGRPDTERLTLWVVPETRVTVIVLEPELPCVAVIPPLLLKEKSKGGAGVTFKLNAVVRVKPPPVPVTVILYEPLGVDDEVLMLHVLVNVGLPEAGVNEAEAPEGRPDTDR